MRSSLRFRTGSAPQTAILINLAVALAACDPALLTPEQQLLVTDTTDVSQFTLTVKPNTTTLKNDPTIFTYELISTEIARSTFKGTISMALSVLPQKVGLVEGVTPDNFPI